VSVPGLSYIVFRCADLERSRQFYETLGLQLTLEQHGNGLKHYSCDLGGVTLELYPLAARSTSGLRLGLVVSDLGRVMTSLRSKAMAVTMRSSEGTASATVTDPDGHQIELEQERPAG
jgi:lactoylglutathione lyase